jgi:hypothetical protein
MTTNKEIRLLRPSFRPPQADEPESSDFVFDSHVSACFARKKNVGRVPAVKYPPHRRVTLFSLSAQDNLLPSTP